MKWKCLNDPKFSDRQISANRSGSTFFAILSASFRRITLYGEITVKFRIIAAFFSAVRIFQIFMVGKG